MWDDQKPREKPAQFSKYFQKTGFFQRLPDNPYAHATFLLSSKGRTVNEDSDFNELEDPNALLGFIGNDKMIQLNQVSIVLLENFHAMAKKDRGMFSELTQVLYHGWVFSIRFTANKDGVERRLQNAFTPAESQGMEGYGKAWQKEEEKRRQAEAEAQQKLTGGMYA